jgi:DNA-binding CsgD family transcriptional regulator
VASASPATYAERAKHYGGCKQFINCRRIEGGTSVPGTDFFLLEQWLQPFYDEVMRTDSRGLPWPRINDYVVSLGSATSRQELLQVAVDGIADLIPYDSSAGIFDRERKFLCGIGLSESLNKKYNEHYRFVHVPFSLPDGPAYSSPQFLGMRFFEFRSFAHSEYYTDFAGPNGLEHSLLAPLPWGRIMIIMTRTIRTSLFSDKDARTMEILNTHLNNLYSIFEKAAAHEADPPTEDEIRIRFPALSRREAEVGRLLCLGLSASEIASKLYVSERTVETHVAHIYEKLGVRKKREAIALLKGGREESRHG